MAMILDLGQPYASLELIRVTAAYSNAVLVAVLPYISDVAQKLDLPVVRPVTAEQVLELRVLPNRRVGAWVRVKGDWTFAFNRGYVRTIQSTHSYTMLQDPDEIPQFLGEIRMSRVEAVQLARDSLKKLGIPLESVFAEQEPQVTGPHKIGTNIVPHYNIVWPDPVAGSSVNIEVNGQARRVERIELDNKSLERAPPKLAVIPPREPNQPMWPLVNLEYAKRLIPIVLSAIDDYAQKLSLPVPRPLATNHVARFSVADNGDWPHCEIELTNSWRFIYRNSMVMPQFLGMPFPR